MTDPEPEVNPRPTQNAEEFPTKPTRRRASSIGETIFGRGENHRKSSATSVTSSGSGNSLSRFVRNFRRGSNDSAPGTSEVVVQNGDAQLSVPLGRKRASTLGTQDNVGSVGPKRRGSNSMFSDMGHVMRGAVRRGRDHGTLNEASKEFSDKQGIGRSAFAPVSQGGDDAPVSKSGKRNTISRRITLGSASRDGAMMENVAPTGSVSIPEIQVENANEGEDLGMTRRATTRRLVRNISDGAARLGGRGRPVDHLGVVPPDEDEPRLREGDSDDEEEIRPQRRRSTAYAGDMAQRMMDDARALMEGASDLLTLAQPRSSRPFKRSKRARQEKVFLNVVVFEAKGLLPTKMSGTSSPYVVTKFENHKVRSRTKRLTINPRWNQEWQFPVTKGKPVVNFTIRGKRKLLFKSMGTVMVDLSEMTDYNKWYTEWHRIVPPGGGHEKGAGDILLGFSFTVIAFDGAHAHKETIERAINVDGDRVPAEPGILTVILHEGRDLQAMDVGGTSDPYVVLAVEDQKVSSSVIRKSLFPIWETTFSFWVTQPSVRLEITCMDEDRYNSHDFMGFTMINVRDIKTTVPPGTFHEDWYPVMAKGTQKGELRISLRFTPTTPPETLHPTSLVPREGMHLGTVDVEKKKNGKTSTAASDCALYFNGDFLTLTPTGPQGLSGSADRIVLLQDATKIEPYRHGRPFCVLTSDFVSYKLTFQTSDKAWSAWNQLAQYLVHYSMQRFWASCPPRGANLIDFYVDGAEYYPEVARAMKNARHSIYIVDWWLSPEVYLLRDKQPPSMKYRLDNLLQFKAMQGVKIYVVLYAETAVQLNSSNAARVLQALHPNIKVETHGPPVSKILFSPSYGIAFVGGLDLCFGRYDTHEHPLVDDKGPYTFYGIDYYNPELGGITNEDLSKPYADILDRTTQPRMPWHDVHSKVSGPAARDVALTFIQRWNATGNTEPIVPRPWEEVTLPPGCPGTTTVQVLRSMSWWSGNSYKERSICEAYMSCIRKAQRFIYIEQQFFISGFNDRHTPLSPTNLIAQALYDRLVQAIEGKEDLVVVIVVPEAPEGSISAKTTQAVMHWQYRTICRGTKSLMARLRAKLGDRNFDRYIGFFSLRGWGVLNDTHVTNQIYVHSKLMIVDDAIAIIGSANINDRSMLGSRDSEICVHVEDNVKVEQLMRGTPCMVSPSIQSFRQRLWNHHLGLPHDSKDTQDPLSAFTYHWLPTAETNTEIYHTVWPRLPHNSIKKFRQMSRLPKGPITPEKLTEVQGHLIRYPLEFLSKEHLDTDFGDKEALLNKKMFQ